MNWVLTIPVLSTKHIQQQVAVLLAGMDGMRCTVEGVVICSAYPEGFFILFDSDIDPQHPDLLAIRDWLAANNYTDRWVRLDADGDHVDGLTTYDW